MQTAAEIANQLNVAEVEINWMASEVLLTFAGYKENPLVHHIEYTKYGYNFSKMKEKHLS